MDADQATLPFPPARSADPHQRRRKRKPAKNLTSFELPPEQRAQLDAVRAERGLNLGEAVREALQEWFERHGVDPTEVGR